MNTRESLVMELRANMEALIVSNTAVPYDYEAIIVNRVLCEDTLKKLEELDNAD